MSRGISRSSWSLLFSILTATAMFVGVIALAPNPVNPVEEVGAVTETPGVYVGDLGPDLHKLDPETGDEIWTYTGHTDAPQAIEVDTANASVYSGDNAGAVHKVDADTGEAVWTYNNMSNVQGLGIDGSYVYAGGQNNAFHKIDAETGDFVWSVSTSNSVNGIATDNSGNLYVVIQSTSLVKYDADTGNEIWTVSTLNNPQAVEYGGDGHVFVVDGDTGDPTYKIHPNGTVVWSQSSNSGTRGVGVDSTGAYSGGNNDAVDKYALENGSILWTHNFANGIQAVASDQVNWVYAGGNDGEVYKMDPSDGSVQWTFSSGEFVLGLAVDNQSKISSSGGGSGGGSSTTEDSLNESGYTQAFEVVSYDQEYFNDQFTTIETHYIIGTDPDDDRDWNGQTELENTAEVGSNGVAYMEVRDGGTYRIRVEGFDGNVVDTIFFTGDASQCEDQFSDECLFLMEIFGPSPQDGGDTSTGIGGIGDTDDDGVIDDPPDLDDPEFEIPETETFLQTGIFHFGDEGRCVGLRYWDPAYNTTELSYEFDALNQTYSDTLTFDDPVGYYEACLDPLNNPSGGGSAVPDDPDDIAELPGGIDFGGVKNGSEFAGSIRIGGTGSDFQSGGLIAPPGDGDGGGLPGGQFPWILAIVGVLGWVFRDDIRRQINRL